MKQISLRALWRRFKSAPRARIMSYALLASVLCGVTGFLAPLDDFIRNIRYSLRYVPADGSIVVVGIDQKSAERLDGKYPWPYQYDAQLIENLKSAGARKIVFDRAFSDLDTRKNNAVLVKTLKKYKGDVYFGSGVLNARNARVESGLVPAALFVPHVQIATFTQQTNPIGQLAKLYTRTPDVEPSYPAIAAVLANREKIDDLLFRPDFSIRSETFHTLSFGDVALNDFQAAEVANKDVIIGVVETAFGDSHYLPGQGRVQGVYAHAIGAQTLKTGTPIDAGWLPAVLVATLGAIALMLTRRLPIAVCIFLSFATFFAGMPVLLDGRQVSVDIAPSILLFGIVLVQYARLSFGWRKSRTHEPSGLPNAIALREVKLSAGRALIAARIDNHAAITASFAKDVENAIAHEIVARLKVGDAATEVFQGDEGVYYWLSPITDRMLLSEHLDGLHALFSQPVAILERYVDVSVTFGVDDEPKRAMSSRVGSALLSAEEARREGLRWKIYDDARSADAAWQLSLGSEIDRGLKSGEFWLAYQPKVDLRTGKTVGAEVLIRWMHPQRGAIGPVDFIPAAERDHRIERLTQFVFKQAMADAATLKRVGEITLALNVSVPVLRQPDFAIYAIDLAAQFGLPASMFTIEITESVFLSVDEEAIANNMNRLADAGFGISIDDFGTGFSTLESLQRVPATEVKIDQTFVKSLSSRTADRIIVASIIKMAQDLDHKVVAEGVEDAQTMRQLAEMGCDEVQGFFVGRPQPFTDFMALLTTNAVRDAA